MIRSFIAVEVPKFAKVEELLVKLKSSGSKVAVPKVEGMHLTLKFLGDIPESSVEKISDSLAKIASSTKSFEVEISGTGFFPNARNPRVLWIGMDDKGKLVELAKQIDDSMSSFGFQKEMRPFTPHVTVARVKSSHLIEGALSVIQNYESVKFGAYQVEKINLKKSTLTPSGAIYEDLAVMKFS